MWYFTWVLGLGLAAAFSILNAMWFEVLACQSEQAAMSDQAPPQ